MPISKDQLSLLDHISTGLMVVEADKTISYLNSAVETMLQISASRTLGLPLSGLFPDGGPNNESIADIYELITSRDYSVLGVSLDNRIDKLNSIDDFGKGDDPNYMFVPNELVDKFLQRVDALENCEIKSRVA